MPESGFISRLIGIDVRAGGNGLLHRVMIENNDIELRVARGLERRVRRGPAINSDDE